MTIFVNGKNPDNPSRRATARVKQPLPPPKVCRYCNNPVEWACNSIIYNGVRYGEWPFVYICTNRKCRAYVGMHPFTNIPLGTLASKKLREKRMDAKSLFQPLWSMDRRRIYTRTDAYKLLAEKLGIPWEECHFGWFDMTTAEKAELVCAQWILSLDSRGKLFPASVLNKAKAVLNRESS